MSEFDQNVDVENLGDTADDVEEVAAPATEATAAAPKKVKEKARGDLPEGFVTPIGLTKAINERGLAFDKDGAPKELRPQEVYSYIKNAPKGYEFPGEEVTDSLGNKRSVVKLEAGVAWWVAKNERTAARKANAAEKATKKTAKATATTEAAPAPVEEDGADVDLSEFTESTD